MLPWPRDTRTATAKERYRNETRTAATYKRSRPRGAASLRKLYDRPQLPQGPMFGSCGTRERERERVPRALGTRAKPVLLRRLQLQRRLEDPVRVRRDQRDGPPACALPVPELNRDGLLVARRIPAPHAHGLLLAEVGDEGEAEGGQARLGPRVRERGRMEVEAALVRARARVVLEQEPGHEGDAREPHLVQRLGRPASGEAERRRMRPRRVRVPAELRHPELHRVRRDDVVEPHAGLQHRAHLRQVAELDVVRELRLPERAAERVRMVRPHVEAHRRCGTSREDARPSRGRAATA